MTLHLTHDELIEAVQRYLSAKIGSDLTVTQVAYDNHKKEAIVYFEARGSAKK